MEAPEKIYLTTFGFPIHEPIPQESSNPDTVWSKKPYGAGSIEYVRTDAFIDKATKWIELSLKYYSEGGKLISRDKMIEDFRKYMKGE